uniref:Variant surface glycoprotein 1125.243 n=1 Tax=Trypanosoma brucei TaxID=5691 RepID=A0A1J0R5G9_9TRYP|nr:variant surface glycoprotein 1125.243 [Trypanosoma brucei]
MQKAAILVVALFKEAKTLKRQAAAVSEGDNVVYGSLLCQFFRLGDDRVTFEPKLTDAPKPPLELYKLNMSLPDTAWSKLFTLEGEGAAKRPKAKPTENFPVEWKNKWQVWAEAEKALQDNNEEKKLKERLGLQHVSEATKVQIRTAVAAYVETAFEIFSNFESANKKAPDDDTKIKGELLTALYGGSAGYDSTVEGGKLYTGTKGGYSTVCGSSSGNNPTLTVAATFACVCGVARSKSSVHLCHADTTTEQKWEANGIVTTANWQKVRIACPVIKNTPITAARIDAALDSAKAAIYVQGTDACIGPYDSTDCNGNSNGACKKIASAATDSKLTDDKVKRIAKLSAVAMQLRSRSEYNQQATVTAENLTKLTALAEAHAKLSKLIPTVAPPNSITNGDKNSEAKKAQKNWEAIKKAAACKEANPTCEWKGSEDKDGPHCKLNATAEEQPTQTGEAGKTQTSSGRKDKQQKKYTENCKWGDGKCKDSSFLVNNKIGSEYGCYFL